MKLGKVYFKPKSKEERLAVIEKLKKQGYVANEGQGLKWIEDYCSNGFKAFEVINIDNGDRFYIAGRGFGKQLSVKQFLGGKMPKVKPIKYVVGWDEGCGDPYAEFTTKTAMQKKVKELMENCENTNITVYEVKKKFTVENNPKLKEVK